MNILFAGPLNIGQTSLMRMESLRALGHRVIPFNSQKYWESLSRVSRRIQQRLAAGPLVRRINSDLLSSARQGKPDLLWAEKQEYLYPDTLRQLQKGGVRTLHFTPDPYFSLSWKRNRLSDACMPLFDYAVTSKKYELAEYGRLCRRVFYMPLGFDGKVHRPLVSPDPQLREKYRSDVAFVGGWEPRREALLEAVVKATGCRLKIWGYGWDAVVDGRWTLRREMMMRCLAGGEKFHLAKNRSLADSVQGGEIYADDYALALSGARIGIGFLRKICPDQHTTRTFEIPACGSLLLADRTGEHTEFFEEGREAEFFSSTEELVQKVGFYLSHEERRKDIAEAGHRKCHAAGYSYKDRLEKILGELT